MTDEAIFSGQLIYANNQFSFSAVISNPHLFIGLKAAFGQVLGMAGFSNVQVSSETMQNGNAGSAFPTIKLLLKKDGSPHAGQMVFAFAGSGMIGFSIDGKQSQVFNPVFPLLKPQGQPLPMPPVFSRIKSVKFTGDGVERLVQIAKAGKK